MRRCQGRVEYILWRDRKELKTLREGLRDLIRGLREQRHSTSKLMPNSPSKFMPYKSNEDDSGNRDRPESESPITVRPGLRTQIHVCRQAYKWHNKANVSGLVFFQGARFETLMPSLSLSVSPAFSV